MAGLEEVLERLDQDPVFRRRLREDPASALSGYVLYDEDLRELADRIDRDGDPPPGSGTPSTVGWLTAALTKGAEVEPPGAVESD